MWAERCPRWVCHSPAEGVRRRGCAGGDVPEGYREGVGRRGCWKPPHALGGLLCGRRDAPEGCAIVLPRGCAGGARPEGCRCWEPPHALGFLQGGRKGMRWRGVPGVYIRCRPCLCKEVLLLGAAACPWRLPMWAEGCLLEKSRRGGWERLRVVWWLPEMVFSRYRQNPHSLYYCFNNMALLISSSTNTPHAQSAVSLLSSD